MKYILTLILLSSLSLVSTAQEAKKEIKEKQKAEQYRLIKELVHSGEFEFTGLRAIPQKGSHVDLASRPNFMRLSEGNVSASMPYFGVAHNAAFGSNSSGVQFDGTPENYQVDENDKKQKITIKFRIKENVEVYDCTLTIASLENATLSVTSSVRSAINYNGSVGPLKDDE